MVVDDSVEGEVGADAFRSTTASNFVKVGKVKLMDLLLHAY